MSFIADGIPEQDYESWDFTGRLRMAQRGHEMALQQELRSNKGKTKWGNVPVVQFPIEPFAPRD